jgi:hypothetical protein
VFWNRDSRVAKKDARRRPWRIFPRKKSKACPLLKDPACSRFPLLSSRSVPSL